MANKRRSFRVGEKVQSIVAHELLRMGDPRFNLVTITSAMMSPDLRHAKLYWMVHGDEIRRQEAEEAFIVANKHFRRLIAKEISTRVIPELHFYYDDTLDYVEKMNHLFASIKNDSVGSSDN